ncbi:hypothetical protein VTL71DRAFT_5076 [Oculimacula yallundae]|uniref:DUF7918 domain-containing protein n=1 Tax=Oculimacula yallundae TaxID=86028 RepID=A0ABR4C1K9_9HELO
MAVHEDIQGIEIKVWTARGPLQEYPAENDRIKRRLLKAVREHQMRCTVTRFIQSTAGEEFFITIEVGPPFKMSYLNLCFEIYVDGEDISAPLMRRCYIKDGQTWKHTVLGPDANEGDMGVVRPLIFASIRKSMFYFLMYSFLLLTDFTADEQIESRTIGAQAKALALVGEIAVYIYRQGGAKKIANPKDFAPNMRDFEKEYHEKACVKDNKTHGTTLGEAKVQAGLVLYESEMLDGPEYPLAIMKFKYKDKETLKQLLVIPRTPSPSPDRALKPEPVASPSPSIRNDARSAPDTPFVKEDPTPAEDPEVTQAKKDRIEFLKKQQELLNAEIADLEGTGAASAMKRESVAASSIKREHAEGQETRDTSEQGRKRRRKETVTIDLTSDSE